VRRLRRLRIKGWWAFVAWTLVLLFVLFATVDQYEEPLRSLGAVALLAGLIFVRWRALIPGLIAMFGVFAVLAGVVDAASGEGNPPLAILGGLVTIALGAGLYAGGAAIWRRIRGRRSATA
jgi:hypothetical protein